MRGSITVCPNGTAPASSSTRAHLFPSAVAGGREFCEPVGQIVECPWRTGEYRRSVVGARNQVEQHRRARRAIAAHHLAGQPRIDLLIVGAMPFVERSVWYTGIYLQ